MFVLRVDFSEKMDHGRKLAPNPHAARRVDFSIIRREGNVITAQCDSVSASRVREKTERAFQQREFIACVNHTRVLLVISCHLDEIRV